jgi:hypothetical protein
LTQPMTVNNVVPVDANVRTGPSVVGAQVPKLHWTGPPEPCPQETTQQPARGTSESHVDRCGTKGSQPVNRASIGHVSGAGRRTPFGVPSPSGAGLPPDHEGDSHTAFRSLFSPLMCYQDSLCLIHQTAELFWETVMGLSETPIECS